MKKTITYMTTWEAIRMYITDDTLKMEYSDCDTFKNINLAEVY